MTRIPKSLAIKNAYTVAIPANPDNGGGGGSGAPTYHSGPLFLQPLTSFEISDGMYEELGALVTTNDGYSVHWWSIIIDDLTSFSIRAAPYVAADINSPGQVRIAIAPADLEEYGPSIIESSAVFSDAMAFNAGTNGYVPVQWDATTLPWDGPYLVSVGVENLGTGVIGGLAAVQAEIWNVNSLSVPSPSTPVPVPPLPGGTDGPGPDTPVGWILEGFEDFLTDAPVGSFGPNGGDVPAAYAGIISVYEEGWLDSNASTNGGLGRYSPTTVLSVQDSVLRKYLHMEGGTARIAAFTFGPRQLYGRYAIRFRTAAVSGYKVAYLLWPDSEVWPRDGEIDFPEGSLTGNIEGYVHYMNGTSGSDQDGHSTEVPMSPYWHTCVIEWTSAYIRFYLDDNLIGETTERIPSTSMHWVIQTETNIGGTQPTVFDVGYLEIDWVACWSLA